MSNGFDIRITEDDFRSKSPEDRDWITFKAIEATAKCVESIDMHGCKFSSDKYAKAKRIGLKEGLIILGASIGVGLPVGITIYNIACK